MIDFGNSTLDAPPDFPDDVWQQWFAERAEEFEDHWPAALDIYNELRQRYGVHHLDLSPRNIAFE